MLFSMLYFIIYNQYTLRKGVFFISSTRKLNDICKFSLMLKSAMSAKLSYICT